MIETLLPQLATAAPHTAALGLVYERLADDGTVVLKGPYSEAFIGDPRTGVLAGGYVTALLDHVGGLSVWTALKGYAPIATLDMRVDYMRAAEPPRDLIGQARCYRLTRSIAFVRGLAHDGDADDPVATMQAAYILTAARPEREKVGA
ncbi:MULTISPECIES: PaaI family thioesterase [Brevundimonas]|uniref:PaaI family thioesterase n=1 Tax=Brevundimonas TaxID=41275 RepID=UPI000F02BA31|nr:PaaI family thioesterase [Brevundimonas lutea]